METHITDKFYVPEISEFHVGFEYEFSDWQNEIPSEWYKAKFHLFKNPTYLESSSWLLNLESEIQKEHIRVKYLDKEDIESLGFNVIKDSYNTTVYDKPLMIDGYEIGRFQFRYEENGAENSKNKLRFWTLNKDNSKFPMCTITIKNKSELKVLLKQLGIE